MAQQLEDFPGKFVALLVFGADRHQPNRRIGVTEHMARVGCAHDRVLHQLLRARIGVCSGVDEHKVVGLRGDHGADGRSFHPREIAELDLRSRHCRSRVSSAHHGLGFSGFHQVHRFANGRVSLAAHGIGCGVSHFDHLGGVHNFDPTVGEGEASEFGLDARSIAHEEEFRDVTILGEGERGPFYEICGSVVASHGVESNPH